MSPAMADAMNEINICLNLMLLSVNSIERALNAGKLPDRINPEDVEAWRKKTLQVISDKSKGA
jgi:hypothetical protein